MKAAFSGFVSLLSAKVGRCPKCMRASLKGALLGWVAVAVAYLLWPNTRFWYIALLWPLSFSALWLAHIATFGIRIVVAARRVERTQAVGPAGGLEADTPLVVGEASDGRISRRRMLRYFFEGAALAVLTSVSFPSSAEGSGHLLEYGVYCGEGSRCRNDYRCPPIDGLDACCQDHDICYDECPNCRFWRDSADSASSLHRAARACDKTLCSCLKSLNLSGKAEVYRVGALAAFRCWQF